jgi:hypothetical protein
MKAAATTYAVAKPTRLPTLRRVAIGNIEDGHVNLAPAIIDKILPSRNVTLLGAHGGAGKSILGEIWAAHVAAGRDWAGLRVTGGRAVFVSLEDPPDVVRYRLRRICAAYQLPVPTDNELTILDGTDGDAALVSEVLAAGVRDLVETPALQEIRDAARGAVLLVIDNASDAYDADENHRRAVRGFIRKLAEIARENDAALLLLVHIDKQAARNGASGNSYSGSTAWHNSARSRLALIERGPVLPGIELVHEKSNLGPRIDSIVMQFDAHGVLIPLDSAEGRAKIVRSDGALLECLARAIADGELISTARTGPTNAHSIARSLPGFPENLRDANAFWAAVGRLYSAGKIRRESYKNEQRKPREKWVIAQVAQVCASSTTCATDAPCAGLCAGGMGVKVRNPNLRDQVADEQPPQDGTGALDEVRI